MCRVRQGSGHLLKELQHIPSALSQSPAKVEVLCHHLSHWESQVTDYTPHWAPWFHQVSLHFPPGLTPVGKDCHFFFSVFRVGPKSWPLGANESVQGGTLSKQAMVASSFLSWERMPWGQQQTGLEPQRRSSEVNIRYSWKSVISQIWNYTNMGVYPSIHKHTWGI